MSYSRHNAQYQPSAYTLPHFTVWNTAYCSSRCLRHEKNEWLTSSRRLWQTFLGDPNLQAAWWVLSVTMFAVYGKTTYIVRMQQLVEAPFISKPAHCQLYCRLRSGLNGHPKRWSHSFCKTTEGVCIYECHVFQIRPLASQHKKIKSFGVYSTWWGITDTV